MLATFIFERKNISIVNTQIKILELSLWEYNLFFACFNSLDSLIEFLCLRTGEFFIKI